MEALRIQIVGFRNNHCTDHNALIKFLFHQVVWSQQDQSLWWVQPAPQWPGLLWFKQLVKFWLKHCDQYLFMRPMLSASKFKSFFDIRTWIPNAYARNGPGEGPLVIRSWSDAHQKLIRCVLIFDYQILLSKVTSMVSDAIW